MCYDFCSGNEELTVCLCVFLRSESSDGYNQVQGSFALQVHLPIRLY